MRELAFNTQLKYKRKFQVESTKCTVSMVNLRNNYILKSDIAGHKVRGRTGNKAKHIGIMHPLGVLHISCLPNFHHLLIFFLSSHLGRQYALPRLGLQLISFTS